MPHSAEKWLQVLDWQRLPELTSTLLEQAITIQQIAAPTFQEAQRAHYVFQQFQQLGLLDVAMDDLFNVYGRLPGVNPHAPALLISAHTDTVFPSETDLTIRRTAGRLAGPGIGDNSIAVASLLVAIQACRQQSILPPCALWFVANTREEGLGDLGGMKAVIQRLGKSIKGVLNLEGMAFGRVTHGGIASRRLKITAHAQGGHSWLNFGNSSAIHGLMQLGERITRFTPPLAPRTTFNIGIIEGGQSINTIANAASLWLDLRSETMSALSQLESQVYLALDQVQHDTLTFTIELVGDRPAGYLAPAHPIVQNACAVLALLGVRATLESSSTDANIPLASGIPAITIGITYGGNAHHPDEFIETAPVAAGLKQFLTLLMVTAESSF